MGIVFGVISVEQPSFRVVARSIDYEVRILPPRISASIKEKVSADGNGGAFPILAGYIGVTSKPKNIEASPIAMTAPVVSTPWDKTQGNANNLIIQTGYDKGEMSMSFLLPSKFTSIESCPKPTDPRVQLELLSEQLIAVRTFSGWVSEVSLKQQLEALIKSTQRDKLINQESTNEWSLAQYNPPFTFPWLRRNEIWLSLSDEIDEAFVIEKIASK